MSLTPSLVERNRQRATYLAEMLTDANSHAAPDDHLTLSAHDRWSVHPDASVRARLAPLRRRRHEVGHRYMTLKKRIEALDLSKAADWTVFGGLRPYPNGSWWDLTQPLATAFKKYSTLPVVALTDEEEAEWAYETTSHEIHEAFEGEVRAVIGSDIHFLGTTLITLAQDKVADLTELRYRRDALLALTTFPADPYLPEHWGHDTRLRSLVLTPTQGSGVTISPAFAAGTLLYTMPHRGDQIFRVDAAAEDSRATVTVTKETRRVVIRVTAKLGDVADYIVAGDGEAKLTDLVFGNGISNYPFSPAFAQETLAYTTAAPMAGINTVTGTTSTAGAAVSWSKSPTVLTVTVTAADGVTTRAYTVTSTHSSG